MILETMVTGLLALISYMIKENTKALNKLSENVAYCPLNKKIKEKIKNN